MKPLSYHVQRDTTRAMRRIAKVLRRTALEHFFVPVHFTTNAHPNVMTQLLAAQPPLTQDEMQCVYDEARTPFKYGIVVRGDEGKAVDCPSVFRCNDAWFMLYVCMNKTGYETHLARSDDLLAWKTLGKVLSFREHGWDRCQAGGGVALFDHAWGGSNALQPYDGRYWMSYLGGALQGYEPDPLSIGIAWTRDPSQPAEWTRLNENPVLAPADNDARDFERKTIYKSNIIWDKSETLEHPFVMFYNAKQGGELATERIGIAVSSDMVHWSRFGDAPVVDNGTKGISGDPQIVRMSIDGQPLWVMFYFGHAWKPNAFDTFAVSRDLINWTKWDGPHLIEPTEPWDKTFAHKPWVIKHDGVVYHWYCAVGDQGRVIALATSKELR
jgi:predicted GH43/DUF377 family glycosyl hydrolase